MTDWAALIIPGTIIGIFSLLGIAARGLLTFLNDERVRSAQSQTSFIEYLKILDERLTAQGERQERTHKEERDTWRIALDEHTSMSKSMYVALNELSDEYKQHHQTEEKSQQLITATVEDNTIAISKLTKLLDELEAKIERI